MKTYLVQLEPHDDVITARDKITWSKARRVLLLWPRRGRVLERRLDLLLLLRHAQQSGVQLAIVSGSGAARTHARELGIPVFARASEAQQVPWRRPRRRTLNSGAVRLPHDLRLTRQSLAEQRAPGLAARLAAFLVGVGAFMALVLFFVPGAEVQLKPARIEQSLTIPVWASPQTSAVLPAGGLPVQVLSVVVEGREQAPSTGSTRIPDRTAAGELHLTNLTDQAVVLPAGSLALATDSASPSAGSPPATVVTTRLVRVPAGAGVTARVPVQATVAGRQGNLPAGSVRALEGPLGLRLAVENARPISGGTDRAIPAPAAQDYRALRESLLASLEATARQELAGRVGAGQHLLEPTIHLVELLDEQGEPEAGQPGDRLLLTMRVEYNAWVVAEADLQMVAQTALDANNPPGYRPVDGSLHVAFATEPVAESEQLADRQPTDREPDVARWTARVARTLEAEWSESALLAAIVGRSPAAAADALRASLNLAEPPSIQVTPAWWPRLPYLPFRINLVQT